MGEEIGVAGCPGRPNQDDALGHRLEGQPSVAADGPFPLEGLKGLLPSPLHFSEQDIQIDALDVEGESINGMERHVGTEHDFPPGLEHLIELGTELLPDDGEAAAPDGAPQLGEALAPLLLDQVEVTVLAGETALADFSPHPEEASAGPLIEHTLDSGRHATERIDCSLGIRGAISGGLGGGRHEGATYPKKRGGERRCDHLPWKETKTMLADVPGRVLSVSASFAPVRHCKCGVPLSAIRRPPSAARMTSVSSPTLPPQKQRPPLAGRPSEISESQRSEDYSLTRSFLTST